jgi:hypothetical protein
MITMEIESTGDLVRKVTFDVDGKRWTAPPTVCVVCPDDLGWRVCWDGGYAGPFATPAFAQAVAEALRTP